MLCDIKKCNVELHSDKLSVTCNGVLHALQKTWPLIKAFIIQAVITISFITSAKVSKVYWIFLKKVFLDQIFIWGYAAMRHNGNAEDVGSIRVKSTF